MGKIDYRAFKQSRQPLAHSAKGTRWEQHQYIDRKKIPGKNNYYYYPDSYKKGRHLPKGLKDRPHGGINSGSSGGTAQTQNKSSTSSGTGAVSKEIEDLAKAVLAGKYGNGDARKAALGDKYAEVQRYVNSLVSGGGSSGGGSSGSSSSKAESDSGEESTTTKKTSSSKKKTSSEESSVKEEKEKKKKVSDPFDWEDDFLADVENTIQRTNGKYDPLSALNSDDEFSLILGESAGIDVEDLTDSELAALKRRYKQKFKDYGKEELSWESDMRSKIDTAIQNTPDEVDPLKLASMDLDEFKKELDKYSDVGSHNMSEQALKQVQKRLKEQYKDFYKQKQDWEDAMYEDIEDTLSKNPGLFDPYELATADDQQFSLTLAEFGGVDSEKMSEAQIKQIQKRMKEKYKDYYKEEQAWETKMYDEIDKALENNPGAFDPSDLSSDSSFKETLSEFGGVDADKLTDSALKQIQKRMKEKYKGTNTSEKSFETEMYNEIDKVLKDNPGSFNPSDLAKGDLDDFKSTIEEFAGVKADDISDTVAKQIQKRMKEKYKDYGNGTSDWEKDVYTQIESVKDLNPSDVASGKFDDFKESLKEYTDMDINSMSDSYLKKVQKRMKERYESQSAKEKLRNSKS